MKNGTNVLSKLSRLNGDFLFLKKKFPIFSVFTEKKQVKILPDYQTFFDQNWMKSAYILFYLEKSDNDSDVLKIQRIAFFLLFDYINILFIGLNSVYQENCTYNCMIFFFGNKL